MLAELQEQLSQLADAESRGETVMGQLRPSRTFEEPRDCFVYEYYSNVQPGLLVLVCFDMPQDQRDRRMTAVEILERYQAEEL